MIDAAVSVAATAAWALHGASGVHPTPKGCRTPIIHRHGLFCIITQPPPTSRISIRTTHARFLSHAFESEQEKRWRRATQNDDTEDEEDHDADDDDVEVEDEEVEDDERRDDGVDGGRVDDDDGDDGGRFRSGNESCHQ